MSRFFDTVVAKRQIAEFNSRPGFSSNFGRLRLAYSLRKMSVLLTLGDVSDIFSSAQCCRSLPEGI
jgi:hypothetical protein